MKKIEKLGKLEKLEKLEELKKQQSSLNNAYFELRTYVENGRQDVCELTQTYFTNNTISEEERKQLRIDIILNLSEVTRYDIAVEAADQELIAVKDLISFLETEIEIEKQKP